MDLKPRKTKKADVTEHLEVFNHVGLPYNEPSSETGVLFIWSSDNDVKILQLAIWYSTKLTKQTVFLLWFFIFAIRIIRRPEFHANGIARAGVQRQNAALALTVKTQRKPKPIKEMQETACFACSYPYHAK